MDDQRVFVSVYNKIGDSFHTCTFVFSEKHFCPFCVRAPGPMVSYLWWFHDKAVINLTLHHLGLIWVETKSILRLWLKNDWPPLIQPQNSPIWEESKIFYSTKLKSTRYFFILTLKKNKKKAAILEITSRVLYIEYIWKA